MDYWRTENGDQRGGEWKPQISFEIFDRCPKITSSANEISAAKLPKPTHDKSTKRVLGKVETQRNRQNAIWNSNEQTAYKTELADCTLQYLRELSPYSPLQYRRLPQFKN